VYAAGKESLFLKSYFYSAKDPQNFVTFASPGVEITFDSNKIWYPMKLSHLAEEGESYVVLDVIAQRHFEAKDLHKDILAGTKGKLKFDGKDFHVTRIHTKVEANKMAQDLQITP
jgi:hypothetical protein